MLYPRKDSNLDSLDQNQMSCQLDDRGALQRLSKRSKSTNPLINKKIGKVIIENIQAKA